MNCNPRAASLIALLCAAACCMFFGGAVAESLHHAVKIEGRGNPSVVFVSGLGDTLDVWSSVQGAVSASCVKTLAYNRAGYPGSDTPHGVRDAATVVAELRVELRSQGLKPPYVLVGHSLGGLYAQYFARRYPQEIAGLVLVDSTHWNEQLRLGAPTQNSPLRHRRVLVFMPYIAQRELADSARAGAQVEASPAARATRTIVLSSTRALHGETPSSRTHAARLQEEIVASFPGARHVRVEGAGHYIQRDRPETVIEVARELAGCSRAGS